MPRPRGRSAESPRDCAILDAVEHHDERRLAARSRQVAQRRRRRGTHAGRDPLVHAGRHDAPERLERQRLHRDTGRLRLRDQHAQTLVPCVLHEQPLARPARTASATGLMPSTIIAETGNM